MTEIGFYHLTRTGVDSALPQLLGRVLAQGARAVVLCGSEERRDALDAALWLAEKPDWLPHGTARMGHAEMQPIWLTAEDENPNGATFLFLLDGMQSTRIESYARVFDLFDGNDPEQVAAARQRWRGGKAEGHALTYWRQGTRGWEKAG